MLTALWVQFKGLKSYNYIDSYSYDLRCANALTFEILLQVEFA